MAATSPSPIPAGLEDPVTYKQAVSMLAETGHKVSGNTIARWGLPTVRVGRTHYVDWPDVLEAHRDHTEAKMRSSSNWT
ncbi:hypothetical protein AB0G67_40145 [Streptomyces sp. NPDC021056]|uniref:hypothetical protein n=1 Tax=Streptomyces sp. NPDC021056 TaxID=3155012 RepID=UPI0033D49E34